MRGGERGYGDVEGAGVAGEGEMGTLGELLLGVVERVMSRAVDRVISRVVDRAMSRAVDRVMSRAASVLPTLAAKTGCDSSLRIEGLAGASVVRLSMDSWKDCMASG